MGNARRFDGTDDSIRCSLGGTDLTGALTMAMLVRNDSTKADPLIYGVLNHSSGGAGRIYLLINASLKVQLGLTPVSTTSVNEDEWVIVAASKAAGTVTPRAHIYQGGVWTHEAMSATLPDPASASGGTVRFGEFAGIAWTEMDIAAAAEWQTDLSDAQVENYISWERATQWQGCSAAWDFDQGSVTESVRDVTGGGADQSSITGTSVITDGPSSRYYKNQSITGTINSATGLSRTVLLRSDE